MSYEGAMLGGYLLPQDTFIKLMTEMLDSNENIIELYLNNTLKYIDSGQVKDAYNEWNRFQVEVLKNPTVSLLAILNFRSSKNQTWTFIDDEANAIANQQGALNIQAIGKELKREYNSQIFTKHLSNLFKSVAGRMEQDEVNYMWGLESSDVKKRLNPIKHGDGLYTYKAAVYGSIAGRFYNGKIADAYLNHIGATHWEYLNNFSKTGYLPPEDLMHASVKQEERAVHNLNFIKLLMASMNRTAWYTGGDLIVTNAQGEVVANIQLKTSGGEGSWIGNIRTSKLRNEILLLKQSLSSNHQETAGKFYNALKTSSVGEELGDAVIEEAYNFAKINLELT